MNDLEFMMGKLSEEASLGLSRREFVKFLLTTCGAIILTGLGLDSTWK